MKNLPALWLGAALLLAGCSSAPSDQAFPDATPRPKANPAPVVSPEAPPPAAEEITPAADTPPPPHGVCSRTGTPLETKEGYTFPDNLIVDPTPLYAEFIYQNHNYPHATPWKFSPTPIGACDVPATVTFCPDCDHRFQEDFLYSQQLSPEAKAAFMRKLRGQPSPPDDDGIQLYQVQQGDTGAEIADRYNMKFVELADLNPGTNWRKLSVGQQLRIRDYN